LILSVNLSACNNDSNNKNILENEMNIDEKNLNTVTFGSGCFWCTEAIFENVKGVSKVVSGYAGGKVFNPTYEEVCTGSTGHAEVVQITYDSSVVSFEELLEIFWQTHDPTTLNRQGADVGTQYRSVIFYHDENQKEKAKYFKDKLNKEGIWKTPIVTEISPLTEFFIAEKYHQDYYTNNPNQGYCSFVITPKLEKFKKIFKDKLKN
jgi:peptide-methionine (S)-S-oxide reductase